MSTRRTSRFAAWAIGAVMTLGSAHGQITDPAKSHQLAYPIDSGIVQNNGLNAPGFDADNAVAPSVIFLQEIDVQGAQWLRLQFEQVLLSGDKATNNASYLLITSMWDGASQRLYADDVFNWNNTSAYLNGGTLTVELYAYPGTGPNRFVMRELTVGEVQPGGTPIDSICGPTDDRTLSQDNRQGRIWPIGCTGWMIENGNFGNRFLTAGHCIQNNTANAVVEFNVPLSTSTGGAQHPPPADQWSVPAGQVNSNGGQGPGNDYAQFFTAVNGTGLTPREANGGGAYRLAATAPAVNNQSIRITGYGSTTTQPNTPRSWSLVQKSHTGPFVTNSGTLIRYATDTSGGNSGSPVVDVTGGGLAIGIHTHAGCDAQGGSNQGTDISHAGLQGFLANPAGTGIPMNDGCVTTTFAANNSGADGGAVYFDVVTGADAVRLTGLQMNVDVPAASFGQAFTVDVYTTTGTFSGKETNMALWTKRAIGSGNVGQRDSASQVTLDTPVQLDPNATTGIALVLSNNTGHNYTNGNGSNQSYTDGTITVNLGTSSNQGFTAPIFNPRVFNGTICYDKDLPCTATEIPAMTVPSSLIEMDALPLGPTNVAALNAAGTPAAADIASVALPDKPTAAPGVYNTNNNRGNALARVNGVVSIIEGASGTAAFDATTYDITLNNPHTQFGFEVGDWGSTMLVNLYDGNTLLAQIETASASLGAHFIEIGRGCTFNRVTIDASGSGGNFVLTEIWTQPAPAPLCNATEIPAMTVPSSQIEMDALGLGPTNVGALNAAGSPGPARLARIALPDKPTTVAGVYNTNNALGNALARVNGVISIIEGASGTAPFDGTTYNLLFTGPHTEFGFEVGDWNGTMIVNLYDGASWVGMVETASAPSAPQFIQIERGCSFDRATIDTSGAGGNFVLTQIWTQGDACPCACNFDTSTGNNTCDIFDFLAFQNAFVGGKPCACDIDTSTGQGVCDIFDFLAFQNAFVAGCR
jgi:V8-like Glu-specific endopeptidase